MGTRNSFSAPLIIYIDEWHATLVKCFCSIAIYGYGAFHFRTGIFIRYEASPFVPIRHPCFTQSVAQGFQVAKPFENIPGIYEALAILRMFDCQRSPANFGS